MDNDKNGGKIVLLAAAMTLVLVACLTILTLYLNITKKQLYKTSYIIFIMFVGLSCLGTANLFLHSMFY